MVEGIPRVAIDWRRTPVADGIRTKRALCPSDRVRRADISARVEASRPFFHAPRRTPNHDRHGARAHLTSESSSKRLATCRQNTRAIRASTYALNNVTARRVQRGGERASLLRRYVPKRGSPENRTEPRRPMGGPHATDVSGAHLRTARAFGLKIRMRRRRRALWECAGDN